MPVTLKDVANLAGVSESTASRALNDSPLISEKTKRAVLAAARRLDYHPAKRVAWPARIIGVIEPNVTNPLYAEIIAAIEARAYDAGYNIILCDSSFDPRREQGYLEMLIRQGVAGIIFIPTDPNSEHVSQLVELDIPCVILGTDPLPNTDQVNVDVEMGAYLATRHLLELGHRCIALISGPANISACRSRLDGYRRALAEFSIPFSPEYVVRGTLDERGGAEAMRKMLPLISKGVTAVYTVNDVMAIGVLRVLRESGLKVPEDVSLVGSDDIPVAAQLQPALTTVWQPKRDLGDLAAKLILRQIETQRKHKERWRDRYPFQNAMYLPRVIVRDSTCPPAKDRSRA